MLGRNCNATSFTTQTATYPAGTTSLDYFIECQSTQAWCSNLAPPRIAMSRAEVTIDDPVAPSVAVTGGTLKDGWTADTATIGFAASDNVGIREARLLLDGVVKGSVTFACDFTRPIPCGDEPNASIAASTAGLAEGRHSWQLQVFDAAGNSVASGGLFILDRTPPSIGTPSGPLWTRRTQSDDHRQEGLYDKLYNVTVSATDGSTSSPAAERSGVRTIAFSVIDDRQGPVRRRDGQGRQEERPGQDVPQV